MKEEDYKRLEKIGAFDALWIELLNASGWAGCTITGKIVDRRYYPDAIPVKKNKLFGIAEPKPLPNENND